jgi:hypothetical protein
LEGLRKTTENLSHSWSPDLNLGPLEYEAGLISMSTITYTLSEFFLFAAFEIIADSRKPNKSLAVISHRVINITASCSLLAVATF